MSFTSFLRSTPVPPFRYVLLLAVAIRIGLIWYSEWHDARSLVKYTDVDYRVFSDAARFLLQPGANGSNVAQGPWGSWFHIGNPYTRETYRYTPLLAVLVTPNEWLHPSFGKYLFAVCDIVNGLLIYQLLLSVVLPGRTLHSPPSGAAKVPPQSKEEQHMDDKKIATALAALHLLNPMVFAISTRGSSEAVLASFVLLTLSSALHERWDVAAVLLGLSTHWKIYPVIHGLACLAVVGRSPKAPNTRQSPKEYLSTIVNYRTIRFTILSATTFALLGVSCYLVWGYPFLYETYIYHLHRLDHRHNFSPYFYLTYLTYPSNATSANSAPLPFFRRVLRSPLTSFVPQMVLALGTGLLFGRRKDDLIFAWFVQTVVFVVFNKVCTSQYFLWYLTLLPLLIPNLHMSARRALLYIAVWVGTQALWLSEAYRLEFLGENVFYSLWLRSLVYVVGNCWVLVGIMSSYKNVSS
ncbi:glycosyltransferase family 50 protein [Plicaturopsis crispa FD-325 SS-3]|nr:glycosyltransferase family 50 protein [Plicaturopsis crispa FD-325 SS-3]